MDSSRKWAGGPVGALRCGAIAALVLLWHTAAAQYPVKPIRVVITYAGGAEVIGRFIAQKMSEPMGQPIVLDPQVGANGSVGAMAVVRAPADGYTLLSSTGATLLIRNFLVKDVPYDAFRDLTPVGQIFDAVATVVANPGAPATFPALVEYTRNNPDRTSYGTSGIGSAYHFAGELIRLLTGAQMVHVPYKAGSQNLLDLTANRIQVTFSVYASTQPFVASGKARNLALITDQRFAPVADVPTLRELIPGFESPPFWGALFGPAGLPAPIVARVQRELVAAIRLPEVRARMEGAGLLPVGGTPEELAALMKRNVASLAKVARAAGIEPE